MYWYFLSCWFCVNGPAWCLVFLMRIIVFSSIVEILCLMIAHRATVMRLTCAWCCVKRFATPVFVCILTVCMLPHFTHSPSYPITFLVMNFLSWKNTYPSIQWRSILSVDRNTYPPAMQALSTRVSWKLTLVPRLLFWSVSTLWSNTTYHNFLFGDWKIGNPENPFSQRVNQLKCHSSW